MNRPSLSSSDRSANDATSRLWVTSKNATSSSSCSLANRDRTSLLVMGSKAPVGSSASMSLGFVISALAMATLCCSPPESWAGIPLHLLPIPSLFRRSSAFFLAYAALAPWCLRGWATLSIAFMSGSRFASWKMKDTVSWRKETSSGPVSLFICLP